MMTTETIEQQLSNIGKTLRNISYALPLTILLTTGDLQAQRYEPNTPQSLSSSPQHNLQLGVETIIDLAKQQIQDAYKLEHNGQHHDIQIHITDKHTYNELPNYYNNEKLGDLLDHHKLHISKIIKISRNNKTVRLGGKEGEQYLQIIQHIAHSMGLSANKSDHNTIQINNESTILTILNTYPELLSYPYIADLYNLLKNQKELHRSLAKLMTILDKYFIGQVIERVYANDDQSDSSSRGSHGYGHNQGGVDNLRNSHQYTTSRGFSY